jgi:type II secretory pathway component PulM
MIAIIAFAAGAFAVVLIVLGIRRLRHAGRKQLQERIRTLQDENARLHTQRNLQNIVRIPEAAPEPAPEPAPVADVTTMDASPPPGQTQPTTTQEPAPGQTPPTETMPDQPATKW